MSWSIGYDANWQRDVGYGVPAYCDHPGCSETIDRGLAYVCGREAYGGELGCGLYFCEHHRGAGGLCGRCLEVEVPFKPQPEHPRWVKHKLTHPSWAAWREEHPEEVAELTRLLYSTTEGEEGGEHG